MPEFNYARRFGFGIFCTLANPAEGGRVAAIMASKPAGAPELSVRFNQLAPLQHAVVAQANGETKAVPVIQYSGPPVWRLELTPGRIDVHVDAQGYEDMAQKPLPLDTVCRRIAPNFGKLVTEVPLQATRALVTVTLETANPDLAMIAQEFCLPSLQEDVRTGAVNELMVRRNRPVVWDLAGQSMTVNQLEIAQSIQQVIPGQAEMAQNLMWQLDINTNPVSTLLGTPDALAAFFKQAVEVADARIRELEQR